MNASEILIYQDLQGKIRIDVHLEDETVWLTQEQIAQLFGKAKSTINEHIKNIFAEGELVEGAVMKKFGISEFLGGLRPPIKPPHIIPYNPDIRF
ncbi:MAG: hypothetical protein R6W72_08105 [Desulfurivibrionaceae bacterium]